MRALMGVLVVLVIGTGVSAREEPVLLERIASLGAGPSAENSGIVASRRHDDLYWMHNDSGNEARVYALRGDGTVVQSRRAPETPGVLIGGVLNNDWEDIAIDASDRLIVADIGNNKQARGDLVLLRFAEPAPEAAKTSAPELLRFRYPDQTARPAPSDDRNFDAEAVFTIGDTVYLLTKHRSDTFTKLYRLDEVEPGREAVLTYLDRFDVGGRVTGADASADGLRLVVLTYERVWLFERRSRREPFFAGRVSSVAYRLDDNASDAEAVCFAGDDRLLIADEGRAALYGLDLARVPEVRASRTSDGSGPTVSVMGFNVRYAGGDRGPNGWSRRRALVAAAVLRDPPDVLMTQEVLPVQRAFLDDRLAGYASVGVGRDDGVLAGEQMAIWYDEARFVLLGSGHFWLSETPRVPGSSSWSSACARMATWVRLFDRDAGRAVVCCSVHLDHRSETARVEGAAVLRRSLLRIAGEDPVVIAGDFNMADTHPVFERLTSDGWRDPFRVLFPIRDSDECTFHGWSGRFTGPRIDWILSSSSFGVVSASIDRSCPDGRWPSDHTPVRALLRYGD